MKKKVLLSLFIMIAMFTITGCGKEKRTIDYLLKGYVKAYTKADLESTKDIFPAYYLKYNKKYVNQKSLNKELKNAKDLYGNDFNITYKVDKETKFTEKELKEYNKKIKKYYKTKDQANECYKYEGNITLKGSKKTDKMSLVTIARCKFDDNWYIVRK